MVAILGTRLCDLNHKKQGNELLTLQQLKLSQDGEVIENLLFPRAAPVEKP
jgi:hypothetical protein